MPRSDLRVPPGLVLTLGLWLGFHGAWNAPGWVLAIPLAGLPAVARWSRLRSLPGLMTLLVLAAGALLGTVRMPQVPTAIGTSGRVVRLVGKVTAWEVREQGVAFQLMAYRVGETCLPRGVPLRGWGPRDWGSLPASSWMALEGRVVPERGATNPGTRDWSAAGRLQVPPDSPVSWGPGKPPAMMRLRHRIETALQGGLGGVSGRLATAVLLGRSGALQPAERERFRRCGASHLVAVSGLHVGLVSLLAGLVLAPWGRIPGSCAALGAGLGYAALAGWSPSATRASFMIGGVLLGAALRRPRPTHEWLSLALPWLLWAHPPLVRDVGFQLSVGAVGGILLFAGLAPQAGPGTRFSRWQGVTAGLGAQWGTLPTAIPVFGTIAPLGIIPNIIAIPLTGLFLPAALLSVAGTVLGVEDSLFHHAARLLGEVIVALLGWCAERLPYFTGLAEPPGWVRGVFPLLLGAWFCLAPRRRERGPLRLGALAVAGLAVGLVFAPWPPPPGPWALFLDVGQGDAAVVHLSDGTTWLMDTGDDRGPGDAASNAILPALRKMRVRRLEGLVLSHRHRDHVGALATLLDGIPVTGVHDGGSRSAGATSARVDSILAARDMVPCIVAAGDTLHAWPGGHLVVLHPPPEPESDPGGDVNDRSVVVHVQDRSWSLLFTGDMERPAEQELLRSGLTRGATIVKVAHHGSATSSSPEFLRAVRPEVMVISCGTGNRYGHPAAGTLATLMSQGGYLHRTDRDGALWARPGGRNGPELQRYPPRPGSGPRIAAATTH